MIDREPQKLFGKNASDGHAPQGLVGSVYILIYLFAQLIISLPTLLRLRKTFKNKIKNKDLSILIFSDNLDEVNGIANNSRLVVNHLRNRGKNVVLMGVAFHTRKSGIIESNGTILLPRKYSMEQLGYENSELSIPTIKYLLSFLKKFSPDMVELETPAPGAWMMLFICKITGIKVISHYRTDIFAYTELLLKNPIAKAFAKFWTIIFCKLTTPVIVPSTDFRKKLIDEMGLSVNEIVKIDRGINLSQFYPEIKNENLIPEIASINASCIFCYVGRVSKEKELPFLVKVWKKFLRNNGDVHLLIVGTGPYLEEMKKELDGCQTTFTGQLNGKELAYSYAAADYFVFPSGTDTFGNVVVESIACGTPALVSDSGGPKDIIENGKNGFVIGYNDFDEWYLYFTKLHEIKVNDSKRFNSLCKAAVKRSKDFSLDAACDDLWNFYLKELS